MTLPPEAIEEFIGLYRLHFGETLSEEIAVIEANNLIEIVSLTQPTVNKTNNTSYNEDVDTVDM